MTVTDNDYYDDIENNSHLKREVEEEPVEDGESGANSSRNIRNNREEDEFSDSDHEVICNTLSKIFYQKKPLKYSTKLTNYFCTVC